MTPTPVFVCEPASIQPPPSTLEAKPSPLSYSTPYGSHDLVRYIAMKHLQHVNAIGVSYTFVLVAALGRNLNSWQSSFSRAVGETMSDTRKQTELHKIVE